MPFFGASLHGGGGRFFASLAFIGGQSLLFCLVPTAGSIAAVYLLPLHGRRRAGRGAGAETRRPRGVPRPAVRLFRRPAPAPHALRGRERGHAPGAACHHPALPREDPRHPRGHHRRVPRRRRAPRPRDGLDPRAGPLRRGRPRLVQPLRRRREPPRRPRDREHRLPGEPPAGTLLLLPHPLPRARAERLDRHRPGGRHQRGYHPPHAHPLHQ